LRQASRRKSDDCRYCEKFITQHVQVPSSRWRG
jgi:hypothetical protein